MTEEIPQYCLKAFALLFSKNKDKKEFKQSELRWFVSESMKKKIFSILLNAGWIKKESRTTYRCIDPENIITHLLDFKLPEIIIKAKKQYAFTNLSAVEIWSDFSYIQRSREKSPYFIKVLQKDIGYWKDFFNQHNMPNYIDKGTNIGEYVILIPVKNIDFTEKDGLNVETLKETIKIAEKNEMYRYPLDYMRKKYA